MILKLTLLILFTSCSKQVLSPPTNQEILEADNKKLAVKIYKQYVLANAIKVDSPNRSCEIFKQISKIRDFPVPELTQIRSFEVCPKEEVSKMALNFEPTEGFSEFFADTLIERFNGEPSSLLSHAYRVKSQSQKKQFLKEKFLNLAIKYSPTETEKIKLREKLYEVAPRLNPEPLKEQWLSVADDLRKNRDFSKARTFYIKILKITDTEETEKIYEVLKNYAQTYKLARDRKSYLEALKKIDKNLRENAAPLEMIGENIIEMARTTWTLGNNSAAREYLVKINENFSDNLKARALWVLASIYFEEEKSSEGLKYLDDTNSMEVTDSDLLSEIAWTRGFAHYRQGNWIKSSESFKKVIDSDNEEIDKSKFYFWLGKIYKNLGNLELSSENFNKSYEQNPLGYYGIVSKIHINKAFYPLNFESPKTKSIPHVDWLLTFNEVALAKNFLEYEVSELEDNDDEEVLNYLPRFYAAEFYLAAIKNYYKLSEDLRKNSPENTLRFAFPTPFSTEINAASERFKVDPFLIFSLIRQESAFDHEARSPADAFGLMQLIPEKAEKLSKPLNINYEKFQDLYDPEVNIALGTYLLSELLKNNKKQFISAMASYNAGSGAVRRWYKDRYHSDPFVFIERIAYSETRKYVKLIFRNYVTYRRLLSKNPFVLKEDFFNH